MHDLTDYLLLVGTLLARLVVTVLTLAASPALFLLSRALASRHTPPAPPRSTADPATGAAILITGASAGIGAALAIEYARRSACADGAVALHLLGRNAERLAAVAAAATDAATTARAAAAVKPSQDGTAGLPPGSPALRVHTAVCDVGAGPAAIDAAVDAAEAAEAAAGNTAGLTTFLINAGVAVSTLPAGSRALGAAQPILSVNLLGAIATAAAGVRVMAPRRRGHLVFIGSATADFVGVPAGFASYGASKAGLRYYAAAAAAGLSADGLVVSAVDPWFVGTAMTTAPELARWNWEVGAAAAGMADGIARDAAAGAGVWTWPRGVALLGGGGVGGPPRAGAAAGGARAGGRACARLSAALCQA
ncbi:hypothetical protein MMPV_002711 [Pyropia vietnamensis]